MLPQTSEVNADRVGGHFFSYRQIFAVGDATWQSGNDNGETTLWFRPEYRIVADIVSNTFHYLTIHEIIICANIR